MSARHVAYPGFTTTILLIPAILLISNYPDFTNTILEHYY